MRRGHSDIFFDYVTGTNVTSATEGFQSCMVENNAITGFESGNPDLGGIGVVLSLSILCISCTVFSVAVIIFGWIEEDYNKTARMQKLERERQQQAWKKAFDKHEYPDSQQRKFRDDTSTISSDSEKGNLRRLSDTSTSSINSDGTDASASTIDDRPRHIVVICRVKVALVTALRSLLDSALYLALIVQVAGILYGDISTVVDVEGGDKGNTGGALYDFRLVLYTSSITICPVLTLINTPYLRRSIGRRRFRFCVVAVTVALAGYINIIGNRIYLKAGPEYKTEHAYAGCMSVFLARILPEKTEAKVLTAAWSFCVAGVVFTAILQLVDEVKMRRKEQEKKRNSEYISLISSKVAPQPLSSSDDVEKKSFRIVFRILWAIYTFIYIWNQVLPLYLLLRVRWMRRHVHSILRYPEPSGIIVPAFGEQKYKDILTAEASKWDNDEWSFGQVLTLSLWFPALLEMIYVLIMGEECALNGRVPSQYTVITIDALDKLKKPLLAASHNILRVGSGKTNRASRTSSISSMVAKEKKGFGQAAMIQKLQNYGMHRNETKYQRAYMEDAEERKEKQ
ncbi:hypothetical protein BZA77DRAFT_346833 [Pyronema omphalodes]|nr:hypothetical protein BZA77DRAFT_346833 [Pyronema omphalodes]